MMSSTLRGPTPPALPSPPTCQERSTMILLLILFVVWIGLCFLLAAGTLFLQGYLEESPPLVKEVLWRAAAGGSAVALFLGIWVWLASGNPDRWAALTDF